MVCESVELHNIDVLYNIIASHIRMNWKTSIGTEGLIGLCDNVSVVFHLKNVSIIEYVFINKLATQVQRTSDIYFSIDDNVWGDTTPAIAATWKTLATFVKTEYEKEIDTYPERVIDILKSIPAGLALYDCYAQFSGNELLNLMGYYSQANGDTNMLGEEDAWKMALREPYMVFFAELHKSVPEDCRFIATQPLDMVPWKQISSKLLPYLESNFSDALAKTLYNEMYQYEAEKYPSSALLSMDNAFISDDDSMVSFNGTMSALCNIQIGKTQLEALPCIGIKKMMSATAHSPEISTANIAYNQTIRMSAELSLYSYARILSIIPSHWITYAPLPDYIDAEASVTDVIHLPDSDLMLDAEDWDHRYRFCDLYKNFMIALTGYDNETTTFTNPISRIAQMMFIPLGTILKKVYLSVPLMEAAMIIDSLVEIANDTHDEEIIELVLSIENAAKITKQLTIPA